MRSTVESPVGLVKHKQLLHGLGSVVECALRNTRRFGGQGLRTRGTVLLMVNHWAQLAVSLLRWDSMWSSFLKSFHFRCSCISAPVLCFRSTWMAALHVAAAHRCLADCGLVARLARFFIRVPIAALPILLLCLYNAQQSFTVVLFCTLFCSLWSASENVQSWFVVLLQRHCRTLSVASPP